MSAILLNFMKKNIASSLRKSDQNRYEAQTMRIRYSDFKNGIEKEFDTIKKNHPGVEIEYDVIIRISVGERDVTKLKLDLLNKSDKE